MTAVTPILASERTAAKLLDMKPGEFRALVNCGALPAPKQIGDFKRWDVDQIREILTGKAARPAEDFEL